MFFFCGGGGCINIIAKIDAFVSLGWYKKIRLKRHRLSFKTCGNDRSSAKKRSGDVAPCAVKSMQGGKVATKMSNEKNPLL